MSVPTWKNVTFNPSSNSVSNIAAIKGMGDASDRMNIFKTMQQNRASAYDTAEQARIQGRKEDRENFAFDKLKSAPTEAELLQASADAASTKFARDMALQAQKDKATLERQTAKYDSPYYNRLSKGKILTGDKPAVSTKEAIEAYDEIGWGLTPTENKFEFQATGAKYGLNNNDFQRLLGESDGNPDTFEELAAAEHAINNPPAPDSSDLNKKLDAYKSRTPIENYSLPPRLR